MSKQHGDLEVRTTTWDRLGGPETTQVERATLSTGCYSKDGRGVMLFMGNASKGLAVMLTEEQVQAMIVCLYSENAKKLLEGKP